MKAGKMAQKGPLHTTQAVHTVPGSIHQWFASDLQFHRLYPEAVQVQANMHWTPLHVARKAAEFLTADHNKRVLDIGSGAGKFCLAAAYYCPDGIYTGVEQRANLVACAEDARRKLGFANVSFLHQNILHTDLSDYDHFYFFNAFFENLDDSFRIDEEVVYSRERYAEYNRYLFRQLEKKPAGTRLATFHSTENEIPGDYHEVGASADELLKFRIKV